MGSDGGRSVGSGLEAPREMGVVGSRGERSVVRAIFRFGPGHEFHADPNLMPFRHLAPFPL